METVPHVFHFPSGTRDQLGSILFMVMMGAQETKNSAGWVPPCPHLHGTIFHKEVSMEVYAVH